jgi:hypothetical protein
VLLGAIAIAVSWPWLQFPEVVGPLSEAAGGKLSINSVPDLLALTIADRLIDPQGVDRDAAHAAARLWTKAGTRTLFVIYVAWEVGHVWARAALGDRSAVIGVIRASARALLLLPLLVLTWVWGWYFAWPLALVTLLGWRSMLTKVTVSYTLLASPVFYAYQYGNTLVPGGLLLVFAGLPLLILLALAAQARRARCSTGHVGGA